MSYPKSVNAGIPKLGKKKENYRRVAFGDILYEVKRPVELIDDKLYRLITIKRSRGGMEERGFLIGKKILVKSQFEIQENDFIISKRQIVHGACALTPKEYEGSIVSNEYSVLNVKPTLNESYLKYLSYTPYFQQTCFHSSSGIHVEKMIFKLQDWFKWKIDIPELQEQEKIASFLTYVDTRIDHLSKKEELLQQYKKGLMQKIFSKEVRFKAYDGSEFPNWKERKLSQIFDIKSGQSKSKYIDENGDKIIVDMGGISSEPKLVANKCTFFNDDYLTTNDLVMPKDDIGAGLIIGKVVVIPENDKFICGDHIYKLTVKVGNILFLQYAINSFNINKSFRQKANGTAQIGLNKKEVENQIVPFPCQEEQTKIANILSSIDTKIEKVQKQLEATKVFKKGLLQQMFV